MNLLCFHVWLLWMFISQTLSQANKITLLFAFHNFFLPLLFHTKCPLHYGGLECKSRRSRAAWSNRKIWPWSTKWSRAKPNRVLPRECTDHSKHPLPTTQDKALPMDITRWSIPKSDWLYSMQLKMEKLYTVSKKQDGSWLWLRSRTPYCQIQTEIEESRENH